MTELPFARVSEIRLRRAPRPSWGPWKLDPETFELYTDPASVGYSYAVDLETCTTSAEVLDWIFQINTKQWAPDDHGNAIIVAGLIRALRDLLDPQAHLCSSGLSKRLTKANIRRRTAQYAATRMSPGAGI